MLKLFPVKNQETKTDQIQSHLLIMAALILITHSLILSLAPAVRFHAGSERYRLIHWQGILAWIISFSLLHRQSMRKLPNRDPYILPVIALLSGIGLMTIWRLYPSFGLRQTIWLALSCLIVFWGFQFPIYLDYLRQYKYIWLILGLFLTGLTILFGLNPSGGGSTRWLQVLGVQFQPSEPLKFLLILYLASFFSDRLTIIEGKIENLIPTLAVTGIALLLLIFQRDLGTASIFFLVYLAMVFTSQGNKLILWISPAIILMAGVFGYLYSDVVRLRFDTWLNPFGDPVGASYQIIQSMIAIAEGSVLGTGPGLGSPSLVPVSLSDFIYAAIAEELGFLGVSLLVLLIIILLYRGIKLAITTQNSFHRYLTLGMIFYIGIQSILIIGGNIGLLPLTGVTLPFVSYGGSSLVVSFCAMMVMLTISHQTPPYNKTTSVSHPRFAIMSGMMIPILVIEIIATSFLSFWFMPKIVKRPENPRWIIEDRFVKRGDILDRNNQVIVTSTGEIGEYQRTSHYTPLSPVIGYTSRIYGQTGLEDSMFPYLRGYEGYSFLTRFWRDLTHNQPPQGLDIRLTIDLNLQQTADDLIAHNKGAAILMNANSGEILVMASHPYFDATNLEAEWDDLVNDESAPLVNRVTQAKYPLGTASLPFVLTTQINNLQQYPDPNTLFPNISSKLDCALPPAEPLTWQTAITNGCNNVLIALAEMAGLDPLLTQYQTFGFFSEPSLHLKVAGAVKPSIRDSYAFFLGEETINISPLQMAMAVSTLTNDGILPGPRIVNAYQDSEGNWIVLPKLASNEQAIPLEVANQVTAFIQTPDSPHWYVVASALTSDRQAFTWYIGGTTADWQGQPLAIVVLLEKDNPFLVQEIGNSLMEQAIRFSINRP